MNKHSNKQGVNRIYLLDSTLENQPDPLPIALYPTSRLILALPYQAQGRGMNKHSNKQILNPIYLICWARFSTSLAFNNILGPRTLTLTEPNLERVVHEVVDPLTDASPLPILTC